MNRIFISAVALLWCGVVCSAMKVPAVVHSFYDGMVRLSGNLTEDQAYDLREEMRSCFSASSLSQGGSGINVPQDFAIFGEVSKVTTSSLYCQHLYNKIYKENRLRVEFAYISSQAYKAPEMPGLKTQSAYREQTVVKKRFLTRETSSREVCTEFLDTLLSCEGKIFRFTNGLDLPPDIDVLLFEGAKCYAQKRYSASYDAYLKVLQREPRHPEALYRLGILAFFKGKKCGLGKRGRELGISYMERSTYKQAPQALYYMRHGPSPL